MASERWKHDITYAMNPFKFLTWPIGVWPLQVYDIYSLMRCILGTCCASIVVILPTIEFFLGCTDAELNMDCLVLINCGLLAMMKTTLFRIYGKNLADNYHSAVTDYLTIENEKQRAIMRRHAFMGRILFCFMMAINYSTCTLLALVPVLVDIKNEYSNVTIENPVREYTIPSRCALDYFNPTDRIYQIFCIIEGLAVLFTSNSYIGNDAMFLNIILHMCGQIEILKNNFMNIDVTSLKVHDHFITLIQRHIYLLQRSKQLIDTISAILLMQLFNCGMLLCTIGFQLILSFKINDIVMGAKSCVVLNVIMIQLALYSLIGDYFKSHVDEVRQFIYQSAWYNFPTKLMKNVIFIIMRTQSPVALHAGHFVEVNLSTYMSVLKTSASYLSVLRVMMEV